MLWVKALHVIAVMSWMAGLLYLPRLFVYHCGAKIGSEQSETFKIMERRLMKAIMTPAMVVSWLAGLTLVFGFDVVDWSLGWGWLKAISVLGLTLIHFWYGFLLKDFAQDQNQKSARFFRILNEAPTLLMIVIVIAVIVKPF